MLNIVDVSKSYNKGAVKAVDSLNLSVPKGEIFGFLGPNGAGKTTTIKMMTGILTPDSGTISINGYDIQKNPLEAKQSIGYVPDNPDVYEKLTGMEYLIKSYSHGMRQKIVISGALLHKPALWILDEPLVGLDPRSAHLLKEEMKRHCEQGNTVFFSTHILEVAEKLCDRVGIIHKGKLIAVGTLEQLKSSEKTASLKNIFLELTEQ